MPATPQTRRRAVGATYNLRDVGDYPVTGGARTHWGRLFRCDAARFAGEDGLAALGLRTVVDLREEQERLDLPTGLDGLVPVVRHRPLDSGRLLVRVPPGSSDPLGELYVVLLRERGEQLATIVGDLAEPGALPALVHCAAGKDRTGVVVALVLAAVGVPDDVIAADYALTATYLTDGFFAGLDDVPADELLRGARPESITAMLRVLTDEFGGARAYLLRHGVPATALDHLRTALTS